MGKNSMKLSCKGSKLEKNLLGPYRSCEVIDKGTSRLCKSKVDAKEGATHESGPRYFCI